METKLDQILKSVQDDVDQINDIKELERVKVQYLGKKGELTLLLKSLGQLSAEERPKVGQMINEVKQQTHRLLSEKTEAIHNAEITKKLVNEKIDVTLPGRGQSQGHIHPITRMRERIEQLFLSMGFEIEQGPELETEYYNFEALNMVTIGRTVFITTAGSAFKSLCCTSISFHFWHINSSL